MRFSIKYLLIFSAATLVFCSHVEKGNELKIQLSGDWFIKSSIQVPEGGEVISTGSFMQKEWYPATVLNALVKDGVYPDPRLGLNNFKIPDVSDEFNRKYGLEKYSYLEDGINPWKEPYWFRKEFSLPDVLKGENL